MSELSTLPFRPTRDRVVIKREDFPERLPSGLYVPQVAQKTMRVGVIVAIGTHDTEEGRPAVPLEDEEFKVGDRVLYTGQWQGQDTSAGDGVTYRVLERLQLAAVIGHEVQEVRVRDIY